MVHLKVNGRAQTFDGDPEMPLLWYLRDILGLTGTRADIERFSREIGAGSQAVGSAIDHSTSLFVLDPEGRVAGILLRPNDPDRIVADLRILRRSHAFAGIATER